MEISAERRSPLNPEAPEFFPQNLTFFPGNINSADYYYFQYSFNIINAPSQIPFSLPSPPQPFPRSVPAHQAQEHHQYDHDQRAVVVPHHYHQEHYSSARNNYRPQRSFYRRRGSGGREIKRSVGFGENDDDDNDNNNVSRQRQRVKAHVKEHVLPLMHGSGNDTTTVMIRNIPTKYTRRMLLDFLDNHCMLQNQRVVNNNAAGEDDQQYPIISAFDFLYLPMDFRTELNKGYAFVNFTSPQAASKFAEASNGRMWDHFHSSKITKVARARLQGKDELVRHFKNVAFPCGKEEFLPALFFPPRDGRGSVTQTTVGKLLESRRDQLKTSDDQTLPR